MRKERPMKIRILNNNRFKKNNTPIKISVSEKNLLWRLKTITKKDCSSDFQLLQRALIDLSHQEENYLFQDIGISEEIPLIAAFQKFPHIMFSECEENISWHQNSQETILRSQFSSDVLPDRETFLAFYFKFTPMLDLTNKDYLRKRLSMEENITGFRAALRIDDEFSLSLSVESVESRYVLSLQRQSRNKLPSKIEQQYAALLLGTLTILTECSNKSNLSRFRLYWQ